MGLYPQPNQWQCGPFALKHALVTLGIFADEKHITKIAGTHWWYGTDDIQLSKAAKQYKCKMMIIRRHDPEQARRELVAYLRRGIPTLLCVNEWEHWITVVKEESGQFIALDSADDAVLTILPWRQLKRIWVYHEQDELDKSFVRTIYDYHPVLPKRRVQTKARFSISRARFLRRYENRTLSQNWDKYVADLLDLCKPRTALSEKVISLGEFFRRHEEMIIDQVSYWHGTVTPRQARSLLKQFRLVADTYGLVIHEEDEKRAIAGITSLTTLWAAGKYGSMPVYGEKKARK
ncbi:MAG: hypothetical protein L0Y80_09425 [Ignavibacteriae bacterium]|nr:hypothetical protein [Ignavibacteriota bacterium]